MRRLAIAFVLLVALAPGRAPAGPGDAPVAAVPPDGAEQPLVLKLLGEKKRFWPDDPVPVQIVAEATMPPASDLDLPVRIRIDDLPELRTRARLFLPAGVPGQDAAQLDLRALVKKLKPGEHRAVARAGGAVSNPYFFTIEPPGGGGAGRPPPPKPQEKPQPKKPDPGGGSGQEEWRPKFVEPLVREGETIEKKARVPIERPGGGEPEERTLAQAWPELERRKEAALNRPGLSPAARKLVQEYFEQLRPR